MEREVLVRGGTPFHAWRTTAVAAGIGIGITLVITILSVRAAVHSVPAKIAIESLEASVALLTAFLIGGRQWQHPSSSGRALMFALLVFAAANLLWSVVPKIIGVDDPATTVWIPLSLRSIGAVAMAIGSFVPEGFGSGPRAIRSTLVTTAAVIAGAGLGTVLLAGRLPDPLPGITSRTFIHPSFTGNASLIVMQAVIALLFAVSAVGFTAKAERQRDPFLKWVGAGASLGAAARLNYFLFPSLYSGYVFTGDLLRLGFYLLLLIASTIQIMAIFRSLESMALVDPLTGLNNRHGFRVLAEFRIAQARRQRQSVALMYMDLDGMKDINDTYGHAAGDQALIDTATVIRRTFRDVDVVARLGGDEFCVLLAESADAWRAEDRLQAALDAYRTQSARPYRLALSMGVTQEPPGWEGDVSELLELADAAMYRRRNERRSETR